MDTVNKEVIEKKVYEEGRHDYDHSDRRSRNAFGMGLAGVLTGGAALISQWGGRRGIFGLNGGNGVPENVNINYDRGASGECACAPTAFQAWENGCEGRLALTNEMWGLKVDTLNQMYSHRETDVAEKFSLYKSQTDGDFGLYKVSRDLYDVMNDKLNAASFGLYKEQRDNYDKVSARLSALEKDVAVGAAIRPYQDRLIQCEIDKAYTASINYTDRKTCRAIYGVVGLPSTPTVTVLEGANPFGCNCRQVQAANPAA